MFKPKDLADTYDQIGLYFSATRSRLSKAVVSLLPKLSPGARVLDLGCGNGVLLNGLSKEVNYLGLDISQTLTNEARRLHSTNNFLVADITDANFWRQLPQYDFIAALAVFHHLPTPSDHINLLRNIKQHLKPTGSVLVSVWRLDQPKFDRFRTGDKHLTIPFHGGPKRFFYAFTPDELPALAQKLGLSVIIQTTANNFYYTLL